MKRFLCALIVLLATRASASDAYLVRFRAVGLTQGCFQLEWLDNVLFYNQGDTQVSIRLLGMSNGQTPPDAPESITLPPHRVVSLNDTTQAWMPLIPGGLWVLHLDIPPAVVVESRDEYALPNQCINSPVPLAALGKVSMPVVRALVPAGTPQVELGTDLGAPPARMNVGIYNDALLPATATITVRRTCDDVIVDSRTVSVPAQTIVQFGGFQQGENTQACFFSGWARYVTVTVDQPSFVYVANVREALVDPTGLAPAVGLAVLHNEKY
jgi:hypothetical protein